MEIDLKNELRRKTQEIFGKKSSKKFLEE